MIDKTEPDDTFVTFLARVKENETTVAELVYWYWELLEEYQDLDKALEKAKREKCICPPKRNYSKITRKMKLI